MSKIHVAASVATETAMGVRGGKDVDVTVTLPRTAARWWVWHDQDSSRASASMSEAETRCGAWVADDSDDGPEDVTIEGEVTLVPAQDGSPTYEAYGMDPNAWISAPLLSALSDALDGEAFSDALREIRAAAAAQCFQ